MLFLGGVFAGGDVAPGFAVVLGFAVAGGLRDDGTDTDEPFLVDGGPAGAAAVGASGAGTSSTVGVATLVAGAGAASCGAAPVSTGSACGADSGGVGRGSARSTPVACAAGATGCADAPRFQRTQPTPVSTKRRPAATMRSTAGIGERPRPVRALPCPGTLIAEARPGIERASPVCTPGSGSGCCNGAWLLARASPATGGVGAAAYGVRTSGAGLQTGGLDSPCPCATPEGGC